MKCLNRAVSTTTTFRSKLEVASVSMKSAGVGDGEGEADLEGDEHWCESDLVGESGAGLTGFEC